MQEVLPKPWTRISSPGLVRVIWGHFCTHSLVWRAHIPNTLRVLHSNLGALSVAQMFTSIQDAINDPKKSVLATYDNDIGFPNTMQIDDGTGPTGVSWSLSYKNMCQCVPNFGYAYSNRCFFFVGVVTSTVYGFLFEQGSPQEQLTKNREIWKKVHKRSTQPIYCTTLTISPLAFLIFPSKRSTTTTLRTSEMDQIHTTFNGRSKSKFAEGRQCLRQTETVTKWTTSFRKPLSSFSKWCRDKLINKRECLLTTITLNEAILERSTSFHSKLEAGITTFAPLRMPWFSDSTQPPCQRLFYSCTVYLHTQRNKHVFRIIYSEQYSSARLVKRHLYPRTIPRSLKTFPLWWICL